MLDNAIPLEQALEGESDALVAVFSAFEPRLRCMIELRIDRRIRGRLSVSDVVQESYIEYATSLPTYSRQDEIPFYLWLRKVALRKLSELQRKYLGTMARDVQREIRFSSGSELDASSVSIAEWFVASMTSPSQAVMRMELQLRIQNALNEMEPADREVLSLRHFEQLSNNEVAIVLQLTPAAASIRYFRALKRLKPMLDAIVSSEDRE